MTRRRRAIVAGAVLLGVGVLSAAAVARSAPAGGALPVFGPEDFNPRLVDRLAFGRSTHRAGAFSATDQRGRTVTERDLDGRLTVVSFIFTRCSEICVDMVRQLRRVHVTFDHDPGVQLLSYSVDPERDTLETLRTFSDTRLINADRWRIVTAPRGTIIDLARRSYFAVHSEAADGRSDFVHTETLVLVDGERRLRGYYNGTLPHDIDQLIADVRRLKAEP